MGTKIKFQTTKTKVKSKFFDTKAGDKMNLDLQCYVKHKNVLDKKPLKDSKLKLSGDVTKGRHKVSGEAVYKPGSKEGSIMGKYTLSFQEGSKGKTIGKELTNRQMINKLYKENPANRQIKQAWAAAQSDIENWENMVPLVIKKKYFKKAGK